MFRLTQFSKRKRVSHRAAARGAKRGEESCVNSNAVRESKAEKPAEGPIVQGSKDPEKSITNHARRVDRPPGLRSRIPHKLEIQNKPPEPMPTTHLVLMLLRRLIYFTVVEFLLFVVG